MNKLFITLLLFFSIKIVLSQDTIVMRNNSVILGKVMEITSTEVKYNKQEMPGGPVYIENKADVKEVRYRNGFKEEFKMESLVMNNNTINNPTCSNKIEQYGPLYTYNGRPLNSKELQLILMNSNDKEIQQVMIKIKKERKIKLIGSIGIPVGACAFGILAFGLLTEGYDQNALKIGGGLALVAIPLGITGIIGSAKQHKYRSEAVRLYNEKY